MSTTVDNANTDHRVLYVAFELSLNTWKLGFTDSLARKPRIRDIEAGNIERVQTEVGLAKRRFDLPEDAEVICCYEAGREGFWLHRVLVSLEWSNHIIEPASVQVSRRKRKVKTDRVDVQKLLAALIRRLSGDQFACSLVNVPQPQDEDLRHLHREIDVLTKERTAHIGRLKSLLFTQGIRLDEITESFPQQLEVSAMLPDGRSLEPQLKQRLLREFARMRLVTSQMRELQMQRAKLYRQARQTDIGPTLPRGIHIASQLREICGIGADGAWTLSMEFFSWRELRNRRQLAALAGLAPCPYRSGDSDHEQGISKMGRSDIRSLLVELAWGWLRFQPDSELTLWYTKRYADGNRKQRCVGIVALARKLLVLLWRYQRDGVLPEGVKLKKELNHFAYTRSLGQVV